MDVRFYETPRGHSPIAEFLDALPVKAAAKCTVGIGWLETGQIEQHRDSRKHLRGNIWELKVSLTERNIAFSTRLKQERRGFGYQFPSRRNR
jgi:hypothetical protein